jgi:DNA (cytosine-5)-methyltransferase 1
MVKGGDPTTDNYAVRTFNVTPEGGQGADLRATETDTSLCLSSLNGQAHDRVSLVASALASQTGTRHKDASDQTYMAGRAGVRRLTPTECERLQGLPDGWTLPGADSRRYAGLGDAVTANVAEWIGRRLLRDSPAVG